MVSLSTRARPGGRCGYVERRDKPTMRCEEGLRCLSKAGPGGAGEEVAQGGQERTFSRLEGRPLHLALEHGHFVAQGEQLDLLGVVTASHEDHQLVQTARGEVYDGSELTTGPSVYLASPGR